MRRIKREKNYERCSEDHNEKMEVCVFVRACVCVDVSGCARA